MNLGETLEETARREAFEEVGVRVGRLSLFEVFSGVLHTYPGGSQEQAVSVVYTSDDIRGEPTVNDVEGLELRYFDLHVLPENVFPPNLPILTAIREKLG